MSITVAMVTSLIVGALGVGYPVYFHARWGQTLGKMLARIRVVQLDGRPISLRHALLRSSVVELCLGDGRSPRPHGA